MDINPIMILAVSIGLTIVLIGILMRYLKQPYVIAYILAGLLIGSSGLNLVQKNSTLSNLGDIGLILLLFFVGMEISLPKLLSNWKVAILGTIGQIIVTVLFSVFLGHWLNWSLERSILIAFVIVLSSTAVIIKILEESKELHTKIGQNALGIAIVQDIAIIPMMLILTLFSNKEAEFSNNYLPLIGGIIFIALILYVLRKKSFHLPLAEYIRNDHELQVFAAIIFCFGLAIIGGLFGLSLALGAFVAGIIISSANETHWVKNTLHPFKTLFLALFFVYIGILIDIQFILQNYAIILLWVLFIFIVNTLINMTILIILKNPFKESLHVAAILAQAGEFGFMLAAIGLASSIITQFDYQLAISVISLTLLLSPLWITLIKKLMHIDAEYIEKMNENYICQIKNHRKGLLNEKD